MHRQEATGDFPSVCYEAIKLRKSATHRGGLTVDGVNDALDHLHGSRDKYVLASARIRATMLIDLNRKVHIKVIDGLMQMLSAEQQRWVIRIILKGTTSLSLQRAKNPISDISTLRREKTVLAAFHPQAIELFNVSSDLKRVCWALYDPHFRLDQKVKQPLITCPDKANPSLTRTQKLH
jgi:DNA ligase-4